MKNKRVQNTMNKLGYTKVIDQTEAFSEYGFGTCYLVSNDEGDTAVIDDVGDIYDTAKSFDDMVKIATGFTQNEG